jgi:broad specificity phosphatase PhoE
MTDQLLAGGGPAGRARAQVCRLYLVRHGTTTQSGQNRYRGRRDVPLDAQGYADAVDTGCVLSSAGLAAVYTGPLRRAVATAQIIADEAGVPDLRILQGLNNLDYGAWEGMTAQEAELVDPGAFARYASAPGRAACPGGERLADAQHRMVQALTLIGARHRGQAVVAVTHAVMIRLTLASLGWMPEPHWRSGHGLGPVTEFRVSAAGLEPAGISDSAW